MENSPSRDIKTDQRKLIKRKKKADFELPTPNVVKTLPSLESKRLQKRISPDFVPIFDINDIPKENTDIEKTTEIPVSFLTPTRVKSLPRKARLQPRGEGYRLNYQPNLINAQPRLLLTFNDQ